MECLVLLEKRAALVRALLAHGRECCHAIAHAKGPLVREELGLDGGAVKRARHDLEAAQPAFSGALGKAAVHREQGQEVAGREGMRDLLVKLWPLGRKAVRTALEQLVGKVAGRHVGHAPAKLAGDALDQSIIAFIKRKYNLLVGERTAEQIKIEIGSACPQDPETSMEIKGRNLVDGLPKDILIRSEEVRDAMNDCLLRIVEAIKDTLECTPPELSSDIIDRGIMLSGGGALLRGLDTLIQNETGIEVHIAESPLDCVALGAGAVLDNPDLAGRRKEEMSYL